jgi:hypothetical protein
MGGEGVLDVYGAYGRCGGPTDTGSKKESGHFSSVEGVGAPLTRKNQGIVVR